MKKLLILSLFAVMALSLMSMTVPRVYVQKLVLDNGENPIITAAEGKSANEYTLKTWIVEFPDSILSTESDPINSVAVKKVGDGQRFPETVIASVQLGNFGVEWKHGMTLRLELTHKATGAKKTWELLIPEGTNLMRHLEDPIVIPPYKKACNAGTH